MTFFDALEAFRVAIGGRIDEIATDPSGPFLTSDEHALWESTGSLAHVRRNRVVGGAVSASLQDVLGSPRDSDATGWRRLLLDTIGWQP